MMRDRNNGLRVPRAGRCGDADQGQTRSSGGSLTVGVVTPAAARQGQKEPRKEASNAPMLRAADQISARAQLAE